MSRFLSIILLQDRLFPERPFLTQLLCSSSAPALAFSALPHGAGRNDELPVGVVGYNIIDEAIFLENIGLQFSPDLIILGICVNDAGICSGELPVVSLLGRIRSFPIRHSRVLQILEIKLHDLKSPRIGIGERLTAEESFIRRRYGNVLSATGPDPALDQLVGQLRKVKLSQQRQNSMTSWYESRMHVGTLEKGLLQLKNLSDKYRFGVIPVIFPYLSSDNADRWQIVYRIIEHELNKTGFDFVSLTSDFERVGPESLQWIEKSSEGKPRRDSFHFNELGHDVAAKNLGLREINVPESRGDIHDTAIEIDHSETFCDRDLSANIGPIEDPDGQTWQKVAVQSSTRRVLKKRLS
jgi:hypothetical protein